MVSEPSPYDSYNCANSDVRGGVLYLYAQILIF